jgi:serine/threonine protein kinase
MTTINKIGGYSVIGNLGKGAHSTILHIRRKADSREYALKLVPLDDADDMKFLEQARHEFRVAQMLGHANLIKIYCLETVRNWFFQVKKAQMLIEFINGKPMDQVPPMPMQKLVPTFFLIASAMRHMHSKGVYHADLKPGNILIGKRGEVKIIDYGLAWCRGEEKDRIQGTPEYIAPETARGRIVNERSEIFNFGATLYRMATLKLPPSAMATAGGVRINEKTWGTLLKPASDLNATIPESLEKLIHKCLEFNPNNRPENMKVVLSSLKEIADELGEPVEAGTDLGI